MSHTTYMHGVPSIVLLGLIAIVIAPNTHAAGRQAATSPASATMVAQYGRLPLAFERNDGQTDKRVKFVTHAGGGTLFLTGSEAVLCLTRSSVRPQRLAPQTAFKRPGRANQITSVLRMGVIGAKASAPVSGMDELPGKVNYFLGTDPKMWHANIPTYRKVSYRDIYNGIDLVYYGNGRSLEYDFVVKPGADPGKIALLMTGAKYMRVTARGDLALGLDGGEVFWKKPVVYQQDAAGRRVPVAGCYVMARGSHAVRFALASYDALRPLTIDPSIAYSTYLAGSGNGNYNEGDDGYKIVADSAGCAYVSGATVSTDFPVTSGAYQTKSKGGGVCTNAFVAKLNATGSALVYSTYLGGSGNSYAGDYGFAIAVDASGCAHVAGTTDSTNFPTTAGAFQPTKLGNTYIGFVTKLNATGSALLYSTFLGCGVSWGDEVESIAVDGSDCAYVTGSTNSGNFPVTTGAYQTKYVDAFGNAFVTKLNPSGTALVYSTILAGSGFNIGNGSGGYGDSGLGIAVDASGCAYVAGQTGSSNFPVTTGAFQTTKGSANLNGFVTKLSATGNALVYSTYLGGSGGKNGVGGDWNLGVAVDGAGCAYVTGRTNSADYPVTTGAFQNTNYAGSACDDAFVTKLNAAGSALVYSTYLGGSGNGYGDWGDDVAVDAVGCAYVTGQAGSINFPVTAGAFQTTIGSTYSINAFMSKLNASGSTLLYSTYLGGSGGGNNGANGIAVDASGSAYVTGATASPNYPVTSGAFQTSGLGVSYNVFVTKLNPSSGAAAGSTYVLWSNSGVASLWKIPTSGSVSSASFGPFAGWTPAALASDTGGNAYILWTASSGAASVWKISSSLTVAMSQSLGPYTGWTAKALACDLYGNIHLLWNHTPDNEASIFNISLGSSFTAQAFGPFTGWQATQIAMDSGNNARILWCDPTASEASLWNITSAGAQTSQSFGPYSGWQAQSLAVGSDNLARILWENTTTKQASIHTVSASGAVTSQLFGPYSGWAPVGLAVNNDGDSDLTWTSSTNQLSIFDIGSTGSITPNAYGPISGWKAIAIAPGP